MNSLQNIVPPDQKPGFVHRVILWKLTGLEKTCSGITTSQPHTEQKPTELPNTQSVE